MVAAGALAFAQGLTAGPVPAASEDDGRREDAGGGPSPGMNI